MRTSTSNRWVWVFAGAIPALSVGCGDDSTTTSSTSTEDGSGGSGPGPSSSTATGSTTSTSSAGGGGAGSTSASTTSSTSSAGGGGEGGGTGGAEPGCGDGVIEGSEACEGADLDGATCEGEGFASGELACDDTCQLDVSGCESCGDGTANFGDECDGDDLDGEDCASLGFDGGTLACADDCTLDDSACTFASCDDGVVNGGEDCEVGMLQGETCVTQGFSLGGTLACTNCQFDTTACTSCGDGMVNGADECDGAALDNTTCLTLGFTGGVLACSGACTFDDAGCTNFPNPVAGEVVITELMINPDGAADAVGEWFELHNPTGAALQLAGCVLSTNNDPDEAIDADLTIPAGGYVSLGKSATGISDLDFTYDDGFDLANGVNGDFLTLTCGGVAIDTVTYSTALGFTVPAARSLSLAPGSLTAGANDLPANWCAASTTSANFTSGDQGTPGEANPACGGGNFTIDDCRLQFPTTIQEEAGTSVPIFGRVRVDGLTDVNQGGNDPNANLLASVGFGPDGSNPSLDLTGWTFLPAAPNAGYVTGSPGFEPTYDEYTASFNVPASAGSPYDFAVRFSGDGGVTWTYCDTDGSATGGYTAALAGQMVSEPTTQTFDLYFSEYIEAPAGNGNNKVLELYNFGAAVDLGACELRLYNDGGATPNDVVDATFVLSGNLAADDVLVICHQDATHPDPAGLCDVRIAGGVMNFNGNDTVGLWCAGDPIDVIGQIGVNPGAAFGTNPSTANSILRRDCNVTVGDSNPLDAFDPAGSWVSAAYDSVTMDADLGQYVCP